jgi:hypothetical protein
MTKIKNFRITLRPREMARWLKRERQLETTPDLEVSIDLIIKESKNWVTPAAVYTTLTRQLAEKTTSISFPAKSIAVSALAVSIGEGLNAPPLAAQGEPSREALLAAVQQEALAQALHFVVRLVQDQAKEEDCEMSSPISESQVAASLVPFLGAERIGISASGSDLPPHARVAWLFWTPVGKGAAKRAEKVAA